MQNSILVTGGAGFIGSNFILQWLASEPEAITNLDRLTYAGNPENLETVSDNPRYHFALADICDREAVRRLLAEREPRAIVHFAAESHVDRSILGPDEFIRTNIVGTHALLKAAKALWVDRNRIPHRFHHVSTDEVYGSLSSTDAPFHERSPYSPNSPY